MAGFPKLYTYFILDTKTGAVKIGQSCNPRERLGRLRYEVNKINKIRLGYTFELLGVAEDVLPLEKILHEVYKPYRIEGEWFDIKEEIFEDFCDLTHLKTRAEIIEFLIKKEPQLESPKNGDMRYNLLEKLTKGWFG